MGNACKACDQRITDGQNEIIGDIAEPYNSPLNRKYKINKIKEKVKLEQKTDLNEHIEQIIFLQRKIRTLLLK